MGPDSRHVAAVLGGCGSGVGTLLWLAGSGYWIWLILKADRSRARRSRSPWHLLGNGTVVGMLTFAAGRAIVAASQR